MPASAYSKSANKAKSNMQKQYGSKWKRVYYALANKRTGGFKGKNRGSRAANVAYAKGSQWKSKTRRHSVRRRVKG